MVFFNIVKSYADTMIERGRDNYGPQKSMIILSALDRSTLAPLTTRPAAPSGIRDGDRVAESLGPLVGANPQHDQDLLRLLYVLSELTGSSHYRQVADEELIWFLNHAASPTTHLLAWGEHLFWDPIADKPKSEHKMPVHEFSGPWLLWDRCFKLAPGPSKQFALGLWDHQISDQTTGAFDRHAGYWEHNIKPNGMEFARHAGFFIYTWASAYAYTKEETFLRAIEVVLGRFEGKRHPETGLIEQCCGRRFSVLTQTLSMAIDCESAASLVPKALASRLQRFAAREDEIFCFLPHDPQNKGFLNIVDRATGKPTTIRGGNTFTPQWESRYGGIPTAAVAMMCVARYEQVHKNEYRDLVIAAADGYLSSVPDVNEDAKPATFGQVISTELAAFRWTKREVYLKRALELAELAVKIFWQDNPLPRASVKTHHYESITGAASLALALLDVHASMHNLAVNIPANTLSR